MDNNQEILPTVEVAEIVKRLRLKIKRKQRKSSKIWRKRNQDVRHSGSAVINWRGTVNEHIFAKLWCLNAGSLYNEADRHGNPLCTAKFSSPYDQSADWTNVEIIRKDSQRGQK